VRSYNNSTTRSVVCHWPIQGHHLTCHDAFLEVLNDPILRIHILDKVLAKMDEALCIVMNLEALDKSKDME